jgi:homocysteine S-methyltransferase
MANCISPFLEHQGFLQLDGATATELEARGADIDDDLWSAKLLIDAPASFGELNFDYLEAGADMVVTATYQASVPGFLKAGLSRSEAERLMRLSVEVSTSARDRFWREAAHYEGRLKPLVAASLGPYGAYLADGSEYRGDYDASGPDVRVFHRERLALLADTDIDLVAFETIPSIAEAETLLDLLAEFSHLQACLSYSCRDPEHIAHGEAFSEAYHLAASSPQVVASGVNCLSPEWITSLLESIDPSRVPVMVYPNSGEGWNAAAHEWEGRVCKSFPVNEWYDRGARLIGGCCRTTVENIRSMREELESHVHAD